MWLSGNGIERAFADVFDLMDHCRFRDCKHDQEPGCAVQAAIAAGRTRCGPTPQPRATHRGGSCARGGAAGARQGRRSARRWREPGLRSSRSSMISEHDSTFSCHVGSSLTRGDRSERQTHRIGVGLPTPAEARTRRVASAGGACGRDDRRRPACHAGARDEPTAGVLRGSGVRRRQPAGRRRSGGRSASGRALPSTPTSSSASSGWSMRAGPIRGRPRRSPS